VQGFLQREGDVPPQQKRAGSEQLYVTIMQCTAIRAKPLPYSKACDIVRASDAFAFAADLGRKRFVDDCEGCAAPQGLIAEHLSEQRPGRIQNGFCHPPLGQTKSVYVTDDDAAMLTHKPPRLLMQEVSPAMQSSLSMVYDREMGNMRTLLVSPLPPRWCGPWCGRFLTWHATRACRFCPRQLLLMPPLKRHSLSCDRC
jgi:hypothetical protein